MGSETVSVSSTGNGWLLTASGRIVAPVDLVTNRLEIRYGPDWQPLQLLLEGSANGAPATLRTSFGLTTATSDMTQGPRKGSATHTITPRAIVLPAHSFASYEALARRLVSATPGIRFSVYTVSDGEISAIVDRVTPRRISVPPGTVDVREYAMTLTGPMGSTPLEIWIDTDGRLVRVVLRSTSTMAIREDLATVMAREERGRNPRDEDIFIGAAGFSLGATTTRPGTASGKLPAVVLASAPGPQDRDYSAYGVPIFANIAGALADAGHFVVRYDARGSGRSGGRTENASLAEYVADLRQIVNWLRRQRDVDADRIAVIGYGDGAAVALLAAAREDRIRAVALVAAPGRSGKEVTLEQQDRLLADLRVSEAERSSKMELQRRLINAVLTGSSWDGIAPDVRRQTDTPWFKGWLQFDPAAAIGELDQPILIVHGSLDVEMPVSHADRLQELSSSRRGTRPIHTRKVVVEGLNHLLVPAKTGAISEYDSLEERTVSRAATTAIVQWLRDIWASEEID